MEGQRQQIVSKDFVMVVIGQIISLFGNAVLRFALPLHLLRETGSSALLGVVSGCTFIPMFVMSPIGGLVADRVNKRNIMVILDFFTAALVFLFAILYGKADLVLMILIVLFFLYGISGAYQPSVQASIPLLVNREGLMSANAVINMVASLSGLLGPALGGIVYQIWGILPVLYVCTVCFTVSAVMEIFITIPFQKQKRSERIIRTAWKDLKSSVRFIGKENAAIGKMTICCAMINFTLSALIIISFPVVVTQVLHFPPSLSSQMLGYLQGILAFGGLAGGILAGVLNKKLSIRKSWKLLLACCLGTAPMGLVLLLQSSDLVAYGVFAVSGFLIMVCSTLFTIQVMAYIQMTTPEAMIGKVISWILAISTCSQPLGQMTYGVLFEKMAGREGWIFLASALLSAVIAWYSRRISMQIGNQEDTSCGQVNVEG